DRMEVLVVDGMSEDDTKLIVKEIASRYGFMKLLENSQKLSSSGRNIGIKNSKGEIILFVDGHCYIPSNHLLRDMVEIFEKTRADCLCRPQPLNPPDISFFQKIVALARGSFLGHGLDSTIYTQKEDWVDPTSSGAMYVKEVFEKIGYFDEKFDACEDVELNFRVKKANLKSYISPRLTILYYPRENLTKLFKQMWRYGQGRFKFARKHRDAFSFGQVIPSIFVTLLSILFLIGLFNQFFLEVFLFLLLAYILSVLVFSLILGLKHGRKRILFLPLVYLAIHFGLGLGFLYGFFKRS
ncbi:MAG: glycosyltransferase family 2 protein, partial [candidate division Zixibacteria bacterium]|nr:glycosyltransferase family 2 protein [candidate division Zixibacteria bacterium]